MIKLSNIYKKLIKESYDDTIFTAVLPQREKEENPLKSSGYAITWYGVPGRMIRIESQFVDFQEGNQFNPEKKEHLKELINNSEDKVELSCGYCDANVIEFIDILEQQTDYFNGEFSRNYDGLTEPVGFDDNELDEYVGRESIFDGDSMGSVIDVDDPDLYDFMEDNKFFLVYGKTKDYLKVELKKFCIERELTLTKHDFEGINEFIECEERLLKAINDYEGDVGGLRVRVRNGNHRTQTAIELGERFVCLNLIEEDVEEYREVLKNLNYVTLLS